MRAILAATFLGLLLAPPAARCSDTLFTNEVAYDTTTDAPDQQADSSNGCCGHQCSAWFGPVAEFLCSDTVFAESCIDRLLEKVLQKSKDVHVPVGIGAWHWFQLDSSGRGDNGYGARQVRGTYFYYVTVDPEVELGCGDRVGGHLEYEFRDGDPLRTFYSRTAWSYEAYGYYKSERLGTLKAGQVVTRFGIPWGGGFWTSVPGFDGFVRDPDYGVSWEKTTNVDERLKLESYVQYFFHEDGVNNSFAGADSESFAGVHEKNTGVVRLVPTWTSCDGQSSLSIGLSGMVGEIDSRRSDFASNVASAWGLDASYKQDRLRVFGQAVQVFGRRSPERYVSGGPSNSITDFYFGIEYTLGHTLYRFNYGLGLDANPSGRHEMFRVGTQTRLSNHADFMIEYVHENIYGHQKYGHLEYFNAVELILFWHY